MIAHIVGVEPATPTRSLHVMLRIAHFSPKTTRTRLGNGTARAYSRPMSEPDRFKEEIGWLKALCALLLAGTTSLLVWLVQNYGAIDRTLLLLALLGLSGLAATIAVIIVRLYRCFKILEAL